MDRIPMGMLQGMLQRSYATRALDVVKMKDRVPCEVSDDITKYRGTIVEVVFDPVHIPEVNDRFAREGYVFDEDMQVIAVTADGSILLWGGLNSIFYLAKGDTIRGTFDEAHLAFNDILNLTNRFKIKNKKDEIDDLLAQLKSRYTPVE